MMLIASVFVFPQTPPGGAANPSPYAAQRNLNRALFEEGSVMKSEPAEGGASESSIHSAVASLFNLSGSSVPQKVVVHAERYELPLGSSGSPLASSSSTSGAGDCSTSSYYQHHHHPSTAVAAAVADPSELHFDASQTTTTMIGSAATTSKTGVRVKSEHVPDSSNSRSSEMQPPSAISADSGVFVWGDGVMDGDEHHHHGTTRHDGGGGGGSGMATSSSSSSSSSTVSSSMLSGGVMGHLNNNHIHGGGGKAIPEEITNKNASLSDTKLSPNLFQFDFGSTMSALKPPSTKSSPENLHQRYGLSDFDAMHGKCVGWHRWVHIRMIAHMGGEKVMCVGVCVCV